MVGIGQLGTTFAVRRQVR